DLLFVDVARLLDGISNGVPRDLVKEYATNGNRDGAALRLDLERDVRRDRFALTIRVGGDEDFAGIFRRALQLRDGLFLTWNRDELRLEAALDVDPELLLGQIHDVPNRRANAKAAAEILPDCLRLGRRCDDDERLRASRRWRELVIMHLG